MGSSAAGEEEDGDLNNLAGHGRNSFSRHTEVRIKLSPGTLTLTGVTNNIINVFTSKEIFLDDWLMRCFADGGPCGSCWNRRGHLHSGDVSGSSEGFSCELEHGAGPTGGTGEYRRMHCF